MLILVLLGIAYAEEPPRPVAYRVDTIAGAPHPGPEAEWATQASLKTAWGIKLDESGGLLVADAYGNRVWRATPDGRIRIIAGTGAPGDTGDGGLAVQARLDSPRDIALGPNGDLYLTDNGKIRVIDATGVIRTLKFEPVEYGEGVSNPPVLSNPTELTYDARTRRLYVTEYWRVRYIDEAGKLHLFLGDGIKGVSSGGAPGVSTRVGSVRSVAPAEDGSVYVSELQPPRIWRVDPEGVAHVAFDSEKNVATDAAGNVLWIESVEGLALDPGGRVYFTDKVGGHIYAIEPDGALMLITPAIEGQTRGPLYFPTSLALTPQGDLYVSQFSLGVVRRLSEGSIGEIVVGSLNLQGDGGPATEARLFSPVGVAFDASGNLYIADRDNAVVRRVTPDGRIERHAGTGGRYLDADFKGRAAPDVSLGFVLQVATDDDGVYALGNYDLLAIRAGRSVEQVFRLVRDKKPVMLTRAIPAPGGAYYISTAMGRQIWRYDPKAREGRVVAGSGASGYATDGAEATSSPLLSPSDMTLDPDGNLYFVDGAREIYRLTADGRLERIGGQPRPPAEGEEEMIPDLLLPRPRALAWGPDNALYVADGDMIARIIWSEDGSARVDRFAGGPPGFAGDGGPSQLAQFNWPCGLAFDAAGRLFVADRNNHRVRVLTPIETPDAP